MNEAAEIIYDLVDPSANLIFGAVVDPKMTQEVQITLIATGFGKNVDGEGDRQSVRAQQETAQPPIIERPSRSQAPSPSVKVPDFLRRQG